MSYSLVGFGSYPTSIPLSGFGSSPTSLAWYSLWRKKPGSGWTWGGWIYTDRRGAESLKHRSIHVVDPQGKRVRLSSPNGPSGGSGSYQWYKLWLQSNDPKKPFFWRGWLYSDRRGAEFASSADTYIIDPQGKMVQYVKDSDCDAVPLWEDNEGIWRPRVVCNP